MFAALALATLLAQDDDLAEHISAPSIESERWGVTGNLSGAAPITTDARVSVTGAIGVRFGLLRPPEDHVYVTPAVALLLTGGCTLMPDCGGGLEARLEFAVAPQGGMFEPWFHQWVGAGFEERHDARGFFASGHAGVGLGGNMYAGVGSSTSGAGLSGGGNIGGAAVVAAVALAATLGHLELRYTIDERRPSGYASIVAGIGF